MPGTIPAERATCVNRARIALVTDGSAKVRIDTLEVIESSLARRQLRFVLAWAELHQDELTENWRRARAGETLQQVEPLR